MKIKITNTEAPPEIEDAIQKGKIIANFLPLLEELDFNRFHLAKFFNAVTCCTKPKG